MSRTAPNQVDRRAAILDQAERHFADHGYKGAVLADIARSCGLGNAGLIHHFASKSALYRAVLERLAGELDRRLEETVGPAADPGRRLAGLVEVQVRWALDRPQAFRLVQRELVDNRDRVATAHVLPLAGFVATGRAIIEEAQAAGLIAPGPAEVVLCVILGALTYASVVQPTFRQMLGTNLLRREDVWVASVADTVLAMLGAGR